MGIGGFLSVQLAAMVIENPRVGGSTPSLATKTYDKKAAS